MTELNLPYPKKDGRVSLEASLSHRRSARDFHDSPIKLEELSQILWAAQGITSNQGFRTAPSAGALYPMEVYVVAGKVLGLSPGIYHYWPGKHTLVKVDSGDNRDRLYKSALYQSPILEAPVDIIITGVYSRTTAKYGERGIRYVHLEAGHVAQNICLQVNALGLGSVPIGAFSDSQVAKILQLKGDESPLYIIPLGKVH